MLRARPGAINVVPGEVELDVDVRDSDLASREAVVEALIAPARAVAERRGLERRGRADREDMPVSAPPAWSPPLRPPARARPIHRRMISGAYHDAMIMAAESRSG